MSKQSQQSAEAFRFKFLDPYDTFTNGKPQPVPYIISGLCTQGGLSALGGKSKFGKSSFSRYEAVCVSKGVPCIGRQTEQGEVILINLEDPKNHVDNCLKVLDYNRSRDGRIRIVDKLAPTVEQNIEALGDALTGNPDVRFVVIDTLAKFIRVEDLNDYMKVLAAVEMLHDLARKFPRLHIQATAHCKKIRTDDPFDGLLGSTALRAEPDTNIAIYGELNQKLIAAETRIGVHIAPTIIRGELELFADAEVVKNFVLEQPFAEWQSTQSERVNQRTKVGHEERIIASLQAAGGSAKQSIVLDEVEGKRALKIEAIEALKASGVLTSTGEKQSPTNPTVLHLNSDRLGAHAFMSKFGGEIERTDSVEPREPAPKTEKMGNASGPPATAAINLRYAVGENEYRDVRDRPVGYDEVNRRIRPLNLVWREGKFFTTDTGALVETEAANRQINDAFFEFSTQRYVA